MASTSPLAAPANAPTPSCPENIAFETAYRKFYDSLPEKDRGRFKPCASSDNLLDGLKKLKVLAERRSNRKTSRCIETITRFARSLKPYFEVVGIIIQSDPTYAALVWGGLRFIFQLANNFTSFFEKLVLNLELIGRALPQYDEVVRLLGKDISPRLIRLTEKIYEDLFAFFTIVSHVFISGTALNRTCTVVKNVLWKPFSGKFQDIIDRMGDYRDLFDLELSILNFRKAKDIELPVQTEKEHAERERELTNKLRKQQEETSNTAEKIFRELVEQRRDNLTERIKSWLDPPRFDAPRDSARKIHLDGTNEWIFENLRFREWRDTEWGTSPPEDDGSMRKNVLWIHGNPGCGKTVLASSIVDDLQEERKNGIRDDIACFFFFKHDDSTLVESDAAYRSLLAQILHHSRNQPGWSSLDKFDFIMSGINSSGNPVAEREQLLTLIKLFAHHLRLFLIIDGFDECRDPEELCQLLIWLSNNSPIKILIFGRPNVLELSRIIPTGSRLLVSKEEVNEDISIYLSSQTDYLMKLLPEGTQKDAVVQNLLFGADGMFLWARLMVHYLRGPYLQPSDRFQLITRAPYHKGLDSMYQRIVDQILSGEHARLSLARKILGWVTYSNRPITTEELRDVLTFEGLYQNDSGFNFSEMVSLVSGGLVECDEPQSCFDRKVSSLVRYIHLSAIEYLELHHSPGSKDDFILLPEPLVILSLAQDCVSYFAHHSPVQIPKSCSEAKRRAQSSGSFVWLASKTWMKHIKYAYALLSYEPCSNIVKFEPEVHDVLASITEFICDPTAVKFWIETACRLWRTKTLLSDFKAISFHLPPELDGSSIATDLEKFTKLFNEFAHDMKILESEWGPSIRETPQLIWDDVSAFASSKFLSSPGQSGMPIKTLLAGNCDGIASRSGAICVVSQTSYEAGYTAVLSIWPPERHAKALQNCEVKHLASMYEELCEGWTARYELWEHSTEMRCAAEYRVPLEASEVALQLRHSLRKDQIDENAISAWKTSFPLTISKDIRTVIILRTLYKLPKNLEDISRQYLSAVCPMDYSQHSRMQWEGDSTLQLQGYYTYKMELSPDNRFLFFWDRLRDMQLYSAAVFEISCDEDCGLAIDVKNHISLAQLGSKDIDSVVFHPRKPFVVILHESSLYVWKFSDDFSSLAILHRIDGLFHSCLSGGLRPTLQFDTSGKTVLIRYPKSAVPIPISLPDELLRGWEDRKYNFEQIITKGSGRLDLQQTRNTVAPRPFLGILPGQLVPSLQETYDQGGELSGFLSVTDGDSVGLSLARPDSEHMAQSLEFCRLPRRNDINEMRPSIRMPSERYGSTRIVLDQDPRDDYSFSNTAGPSFPICIDRNASDVRRYSGMRSKIPTLPSGSKRKRTNPSRLPIRQQNAFDRDRHGLRQQIYKSDKSDSGSS